MLKNFFIFSVSLLVLCETTGVFRGGTCPSIKLRYGRTRYRQKGRFAKFMCNTGYLLAGEKYSTCGNGTWDGPIPKCVRANCKKVNPPVNGLIYPSHRGAVLNFFCKPGFDIRGTSTLYCDGFNWDSNLPSCMATNSTPSLSCNFETPDLCGWNHDLRHDFDWTQMNFKTPSGHLGTGPSFDHTLGEDKDGYYMYIESSSRKINDTARLISPVYDKMMSNVCLEFYYHMHGASTGQLRVYLKRISDTWVLYPENAIFWKMGNHGDKWLHSFIQLGSINEDFQIIIEGVRGSSFYSDIAIDDVSIIPECPVQDITTERDEVYADYSPTQSCYNRCDGNNTTVANPKLKSCGCDETCTDTNTCCPDYIALCVVGTTDDSYITTTDTTLYQLETTTANRTTVKLNRTSTVVPKSIATTTSKKIQNLTSTSTVPIRSSTTVRSTSTKSTNKTPNASLTTFMTQQPPFLAKNTSTTISSNSTTIMKPQSVLPKPPAKPATAPEKLPSVSEKTPNAPAKAPSVSERPPNVPVKPIAPVTQSSVSVSTKPPNATAKTQNPTKLPNVPAKQPSPPVKPQSSSAKPPSISKPNTPAPAKPMSTPNKYSSAKPLVTNPTPNTKQRISPITSISETTSTIMDDIVTFSFHLDDRDNEEEDVEPVVYKDKEVLATSNVQNEKIVKEATHTNSTAIVVVPVLSVSVIIMALLGVALVRRYRDTCNRSRIRCSGSESQSDVRFLASDEILDFSLAYDEIDAQN